MFGNGRRSRHAIDIWPGYVDALSTLLLLFVFVLTLFMLAQTVLSDVLTGRERALARLEARLSELGELLSMEQRQREELEAQLGVTIDERDSLRTQLSDTLTESERLQQELATAGEMMEEDQETIRVQQLQMASLQQDIVALRELREQLEADVGRLASELEDRDERLAAARDRSLALEAELADAEETTQLAQRQIEEREVRVRDLQVLLDEQRRALEEEQELSAAAQSLIERLTREAAALREQLRRVAGALQLSEERIAEQDMELDELGRQLNLLLVEQVQELSRYRSEFFGRLRELLGEREDIRIVGDRFLFQSELFFESGSAELGQAGRGQLDQVAETLLEISEGIPDDLPWVMQVEGHTDRRPISTAEFPSNWQLSTARAQSIVDYLIEQGVPPQRLGATGFAEYHPVDEGETAEALRRNRRIELRLTSR
ncbi:chemotaxis protein MotB [Natronocella acetinitrilica]|jgi:chemotaxis protein MotB|uniref:Chemotaxis protein MotB n=1 Tax=Natronocella acetinitrilica TaxID=414046 RepID=A0AAE3G0Q5_9GAMM|nr:peptidoglycan -binding protein [Natronocella acetinitrilica]MCP1673247.1 chemotaxis protein MotB [Natronocella acetinitrilica]